MKAILETDRLLLRTWTPGDARTAFALYSDPEVTRFLSAPLQSVEEAHEIMRRTLDHYERVGFGMWAVVEKESRRLVGNCGLKLLEGGPDVEIAYHFARSVWGRGYATEAAHACLMHGFEKLWLDRVVALADPANLASQRVLTKIGMNPEGMGRYYNRAVRVYSRIRPGSERRVEEVAS